VDLSNLILDPLSAGFITKGTVDAIRANYPEISGQRTMRVAGVIALVASLAVALMQQSIPFDGTASAIAAALAGVVLQAFVAWLGAVGLTELRNKSDEARRDARAENFDEGHFRAVDISPSVTEERG
jgi:NAD(P)H-hydrate repair Nnr-like enzyme with NAD(P)H-hydrate dehydratase domain